MFCTKCGKQIPDDSKFCPYCGNPAETPENMQKRVDKPTPHIPDKPPQTSSKKSTVIASVIGIAILLGVITMAFNSKPASTTSKPASSTKTTQVKPKEEVQKIPAPTSIENFEIDINVIGEPIAKIQIKNNSDKTIDGFKVLVSAKDNFGKEVREFGGGKPVASLMSQRKIDPGALSDFRYYWTLHGYENGTKFHAKIYEIHYTDGTSWKASQSDPVEADAVKTDKVIQ